MASYSNEGDSGRLDNGYSNNGFIYDISSRIHDHENDLTIRNDQNISGEFPINNTSSGIELEVQEADLGLRCFHRGKSAEVDRSANDIFGEAFGDDADSVLGKCGLCQWTPLCLQRLATGRFFVLFLGLLSLCEAALTIGYISGCVTSFEVQFRFSSTLAGFVVSCYDIGTLVVILTSYYGGRAAANRPKWIAWSAWVMALGSCIVTLPHFVIAYTNTGDNTVISLCENISSNSSEKCDASAEGVESLALVFLIPGMLLIGSGSTATITLGTTYIQDYLRKRETPVLMGFFYCSTVVGPALGFLIGSWFLGYYVDFDTVSDVPVSLSSPHWVGAWWLGFFFLAGFIAIMAFPVYAFPAKLKKPTEKPKQIVSGSEMTDRDEDDDDSDDDDGQVQMAFSDVTLKHIPLAIWGLLKNPVYMLVSFATAAEFSIVTGFVRFAPKFVQTQFNQDATTANLLTGTLIPAGAVGVVVGGIILNRVKTNLESTVNVLCGCTIISGLIYGLLYIPGPCSSPQLAGVSTSYHNNNSNWSPPTDPSNVDLNSECNAHCNCDSTSFSPVCGGDVAYFNPCFAGCDFETPATENKNSVIYFNCTCVEDYNSPSVMNNKDGSITAMATWSHHRSVEFLITDSVIGPPSTADTGMCITETCSKLPLFLALLLVAVFFSSLGQMPGLMTLLRCVKKEERPFALGLQFVILRLVGFIPAPIYYGAVIDSTCMLWQKQCSGDDGACLQYNNRDFYYRYLGLSTGLKVISMTLAIVIWFMVRTLTRRQKHKATISSVISNTASTLSDLPGDSSHENSRSSANDAQATSSYKYTGDLDQENNRHQ